MTTATILEQISALVDGELSAAESELLLARLARDPELVAAWERYHTIGEALRHGLPARFPRELLAGVRRGIAPDAAHRAGLAPRWSRTLVGVAIAASVAGAGVLLMRDELAGPTGEVVPEVASAGGQVEGEARPVDYDSAMQARLKSYVQRHREVSGKRLPTVVPHLRVAAQDADALRADATAATDLALKDQPPASDSPP